MKAKRDGLLLFKVLKVKGNGLTKGQTFFRGVVMASETKKIDSIAAELVQRGCTVDELTIAHVLNFLADTLPDMIARDGCRRELGDLVTFYPVIGGTFGGLDGKFDPEKNPVRIAATVTHRNLKKALEGVEVRNVFGTAASRLSYWQPKHRRG